MTLVVALSVFHFFKVSSTSLAHVLCCGVCAIALQILTDVQLLSRYIPKGERVSMAVAGFLGMVFAGIFLGMLPKWMVAFDVNKAAHEMEALVNDLFKSRADMLGLEQARVSVSVNPAVIVGGVCCIAGVITAALMPASLRFGRLVHMALNPPGWSLKYTYGLAVTTKFFLAVTFSLPAVIVYFWIKPMTQVFGFPVALVVWFRPLLLLLLSVFLAIVHAPLVQVHLNGSVLSWYNIKFDGTEHVLKNEMIKVRVEYANLLMSKVACQLMGSSILFCGLGLMLLIDTVLQNWDKMSSQGLLLVAVPSQLVNCTIGFLGAWGCLCWTTFSFLISFLLRSGLIRS